jgi:gamma-glutamyltranspeptidase/glutathione hydrolase
MSPTIVLRDGVPVLAVGAAGGPTIISQTLLVILRVLDFGMSPAEALAAPKFHHQWKPDEVRVEARMKPEVRAALQRLGHTVKEVETMGVAQAVSWDSVRGRFEAAHDPRVEGKSGGF